jgi:hypothetical protein
VIEVKNKIEMRKKMNTRWFLRSAQLAAFQVYSVPFILQEYKACRGDRHDPD